MEVMGSMMVSRRSDRTSLLTVMQRDAACSASEGGATAGWCWSTDSVQECTRVCADGRTGMSVRNREA